VFFVSTALAVLGLGVPVSSIAQAIDTQCLNEVLADVDDSTTVGELRVLCRERLSDESTAPAKQQVPVYEPNVAPFLPLDPTAQLNDSEMVFQFSVKAPIWRSMFGSDIDGYFGYTTKSYWQLFNDDFSAPFRESAARYRARVPDELHHVAVQIGRRTVWGPVCGGHLRKVTTCS